MEEKLASQRELVSLGDVTVGPAIVKKKNKIAVLFKLTI